MPSSSYSEIGETMSQTREGWATPRWGTEPTRVEVLKTTLKQVKLREDQWEQTWSRGDEMPEGALAWRSGGGMSTQYLFETRRECLTFMAARARKQAGVKDREAELLREQAGAWEAEAGA